MESAWKVKMIPENFCPICGAGLSFYRGGYSQHRCSEKDLRAIDRRKDIDERDPKFNRKPIEPHYNEQLKAGFELAQIYFFDDYF